MEWYRLRWRIEDWHRVLKAGCKVEYLGHRRGERIERAVTINAVIAWRLAVLTLAMLGGYLHFKRKRYAVPGHQVMWEGYTRLAMIAQAYERTLRLNQESNLYQRLRPDETSV